MKKVINGRLYNTDTATEIGYDSKYAISDFNHWEETLYKKKTGEYFLLGEGGPMSKYSRTVGMNEWSGGSKIIPLTDEEARQWAEDHMEADDYEMHFDYLQTDAERCYDLLLDLVGTEVMGRLNKSADNRGMNVMLLIDEILKNAVNYLDDEED